MTKIPTFANYRTRRQEHFDIENITLTKAGQTFNVYDKIQEAREDTEIYPTLEKYGCIPQDKLDAGKAYADFTAFKELREMKDQQIAAMNMWNALPLETRKHFQNDIHLFAKDGEKFLREKMAEMASTATETENMTQTTTTTTNNTQEA